MPSKNDLSSYKLTPKNILSDAHKASVTTQKSPAWRKPLLAREKRSESIIIKFTPSEKNIIETKAGLVPLAVYLRDILAHQTNLFDEANNLKN